MGEDVRIEITDELISQPLVHTTMEVMRQAGVVVSAGDDMMSFHIAAGQSYHAGEFSVNGDWPSAAAILAAGAITSSGIIVERLYEDRQGERAVLALLRQMGVDVSWDGARVELLRGGETRCVMPVLYEDRPTVRAIHTLKVEKYAVASASAAVGLYPSEARDAAVSLRFDPCPGVE